MSQEESNIGKIKHHFSSASARESRASSFFLSLSFSREIGKRGGIVEFRKIIIAPFAGTDRALIHEHP